MKQVVVPYAISLLNIITNNRLNLYKIWKNQQISQQLSDFLYKLMKQVNQFILDKSPISHYIEWAKKEECWNQVKEYEWDININEISADLIDVSNPPKRNTISTNEKSEDSRQHEENIIRSIPFSLWKKIEEWGQDSGFLTINQQSNASSIAYKIKNNRILTDSDRTKAMTIFDIVCKNNIELLEEADELAAKDKMLSSPLEKQNKNLSIDDISLELIQKMVAWDKQHRILDDWKWKAMNDVICEGKVLTERMKYAFRYNLEKLKKAGFPFNK